MAELELDFEVVWHGGKVDELGTRGGLLPPYESRSTWHLAIAVLQRKRKLRPEVEPEPED